MASVAGPGPATRGLGRRPKAWAGDGAASICASRSWTNSQIPFLKMTLPAMDPKTTTTELKPAIFQFILPLKSSDVLVDSTGAGRLK